MIITRLSRSARWAALTALVAAWLPLAAPAQLAPAADRNGEIDSIVALVDENVILRSELDAAVANITAQIQARGEEELREAEAVLGLSLDHRALDIDEVQSLDLEEVVRRKAAAARLPSSPCSASSPRPSSG